MAKRARIRKAATAVLGFPKQVDRVKRAGIGKLSRSRMLRKLTYRGEERAILKYNSLPENVRKSIDWLIKYRGERAYGGFYTVFGAAATIMWPGYWKIWGGAIFVSGVGFAFRHNKEVKEQTDRLGMFLRFSNDASIKELRKNCKYILVDIEGNLLGTNKKPVFKKLGRMRIPSQKKHGPAHSG